MTPDEATANVLAKIAAEPNLVRGAADIGVVRATYDRVFSEWTAAADKPTRDVWRKIEGPGSEQDILVVEPTDGPARKGAVFFIHGGGWSLGSAACYAPLCRILAAETGLAVIAPDFPQAPEHPYPAALKSVSEALDWTRRAFDGPLLLAGDSAGGTLAAVLTVDPAFAASIAGLALFYPVMDLRPDASYPSRTRLGTGDYFLREAGILGASAWYCGADGDPTSPRISPLLELNLNGFPPVFLSIPELDPLRDEIELYAEHLREAGVDVEVDWARQTIHGCASFSRHIPEGLAAAKRLAAFLSAVSVSA